MEAKLFLGMLILLQMTDDKVVGNTLCFGILLGDKYRIFSTPCSSD